MTDKQQQAGATHVAVKVTAAKGRPMLSWVGKRPLREVRAFPAQLVERFSATAADRATASVNPEVDWSDWPDRYERGGLLFHGDNKEVLAHLLASGFRGKVDLVYIDPPFDSGADYVRRVQLRGASGTARLDGETYTLGEQIQYTDIWANDTYLQFMYERLLLLKELLSTTGALFLHCDWHRHHLLRMLADEIFGPEMFRNEVVRIKTNPKNFERKAFGVVHDTLLFYVMGGEGPGGTTRTWNVLREEADSEDLARIFSEVDVNGRRYTTVALHARGVRRGPTGGPWRGLMPPAGRHWANVPSDLDRFDAEGRIEWSSTGNPRYIRYADEQDGHLVQDVWTMKDPQNQDYPTEKSEDLIERLVLATTRPGDIVLDCFIGSGTTAAVAQKLGRRWIGADINKGAIQTTVKRLAGVMEEQAAASVHGRQQTLTDDDNAPPLPAQLTFTTLRVNDYDLQIQHNEAVNLACEHLGVERTKTDPFFDGSLGKRLVKIVAFNHPATVLDLQDAARELESRPNEPRDAVLVALGREVSTEQWLENYNRHRPINKLDIIELRTDPKYGKFFEHRAASARVSLETDADDAACIRVLDFISPSILERLTSQEGVLAPQVTDWRSMVDSVMIDTAYDGSVFNVAVADIPERKTDVVAGEYRVSLPDGSEAPVAVKITDMLGEEVLTVLPR